MTLTPEPVVVHWEEDPTRTRVVKRCCPVCYPNGETPQDVWVVIVSRLGVAHRAYFYGMTDCGRDATGDTWWWAT